MTQSTPSSDLGQVTVKQAAEALAARAVLVRAGSPGITKIAFVKAAEGWLDGALNKFAPEGMASAKNWASGMANSAGLGGALNTAGQLWGGLHPAAQSGIQGAVAGGLGGMALGGLTEDEEGEHHPWSGALKGMLAGGALGAGGHLAYDHWQQRNKPADLAFPAKNNQPAPRPQPGYFDSGYRSSGYDVPKDHPSNTQLAQYARDRQNFETAHPDQQYHAPESINIGTERAALQDRDKWSSRAMEAGGNAVSHPASTLPYLGGAALPGLAYEGNILRQRMGASGADAVHSTAFDAANPRVNDTYGVPPAAARAASGASPATRAALFHALQNNGNVPYNMLAAVPAAERPMLAGVANEPSLAPSLGSRAWAGIKNYNPLSAAPVAPAPSRAPLPGYSPLGGRAPAYHGLTPGNVGGLLGEAKTTARTAAREQFHGTRGGRALAYGGPLMLGAGLYAANNSGLNPDERARQELIESLYRD